jgi:hypothetical protein
VAMENEALTTPTLVSIKGPAVIRPVNFRPNWGVDIRRRPIVKCSIIVL